MLPAGGLASVSEASAARNKKCHPLHREPVSGERGASLSRQSNICTDEADSSSAVESHTHMHARARTPAGSVKSHRV